MKVAYFQTKQQERKTATDIMAKGKERQQILSLAVTQQSCAPENVAAAPVNKERSRCSRADHQCNNLPLADSQLKPGRQNHQLRQQNTGDRGHASNIATYPARSPVNQRNQLTEKKFARSFHRNLSNRGNLVTAVTKHTALDHPRQQQDEKT